MTLRKFGIRIIAFMLMSASLGGCTEVVSFSVGFAAGFGTHYMMTQNALGNGRQDAGYAMSNVVSSMQARPGYYATTPAKQTMMPHHPTPTNYYSAGAPYAGNYALNNYRKSNVPVPRIKPGTHAKQSTANYANNGKYSTTTQSTINTYQPQNNGNAAHGNTYYAQQFAAPVVAPPGSYGSNW